jgi:hypothetical protein
MNSITISFYQISEAGAILLGKLQKFPTVKSSGVAVAAFAKIRGRKPEV